MRRALATEVFVTTHSDNAGDVLFDQAVIAVSARRAVMLSADGDPADDIGGAP